MIQRLLLIVLNRHLIRSIPQRWNDYIRKFVIICISSCSWDTCCLCWIWQFGHARMKYLIFFFIVIHHARDFKTFARSWNDRCSYWSCIFCIKSSRNWNSIYDVVIFFFIFRWSTSFFNTNLFTFAIIWVLFNSLAFSENEWSCRNWRI